MVIYTKGCLDRISLGDVTRPRCWALDKNGGVFRRAVLHGEQLK
jgi:hypothetical protein